MDKENIGNPKTKKKLGQVQVEKNVWFTPELSEEGTDLFALKSMTGRSDEKIFIAYYYLYKKETEKRFTSFMKLSENAKLFALKC